MRTNKYFIIANTTWKSPATKREEKYRRYGARGYDHLEFIDSMFKILKRYHSLTAEEVEIINKIAKRF